MFRVVDRMRESLSVIKARARREWGDDEPPSVIVELGSGMDGFLGSVVQTNSGGLSYSLLPHFPWLTGNPTAVKPNFLLGTVAGKRIAVLTGRFHTFDGLSVHEVVHPVRTLVSWNKDATLILASSCGSLFTDVPVGTCVLVRDHVAGNMHTDHPLWGLDDSLGHRKISVRNMYDKSLRTSARMAYDELSLEHRQAMLLKDGVFVWRADPTFETEAERALLRQNGDIVGPSIVPTAIAAWHLGCRNILGIAHVSSESGANGQNIAEIEKRTRQAHPAFSALLINLIEQL